MNPEKMTDAEIAAELDRLGKARKHDIAVMQEGYDNGTPYDHMIDMLANEQYRRTKAKEDAAFAAEWTVEVTKARRALWGTEVAKLPQTARGAHIKDVQALEARLGFTLADGKRASKMHNL